MVDARAHEAVFRYKELESTCLSKYMKSYINCNSKELPPSFRNVSNKRQYAVDDSGFVTLNKQENSLVRLATELLNEIRGTEVFI